jgi:hypothetical protein
MLLKANTIINHQCPPPQVKHDQEGNRVVQEERDYLGALVDVVGGDGDVNWGGGVAVLVLSLCMAQQPDNRHSVFMQWSCVFVSPPPFPPNLNTCPPTQIQSALRCGSTPRPAAPYPAPPTPSWPASRSARTRCLTRTAGWRRRCRWGVAGGRSAVGRWSVGLLNVQR